MQSLTITSSSIRTIPLFIKIKRSKYSIKSLYQGLMHNKRAPDFSEAP